MVPYRKDGSPRKYFPDFVVDLENGNHLIVEIKGQVGDAFKKAAAERWCRAMTNDAKYGNWTYYLCLGAGEMREAFEEHGSVVHA